MDNEEFGVYMKLLCIAWREGAIPAEAKARAKIVGLTPKKLSAVWAVMAGKWESNGNGGLVNPRQEVERRDALKLHRARKAAGKKGGQAKAKHG